MGGKYDDRIGYYFLPRTAMQLGVCNGYEEQRTNLIGQVGQQPKGIAIDWAETTGQAVEDWIGCGQTDAASNDTLDRPDDAPPHLVAAIPNE